MPDYAAETKEYPRAAGILMPLASLPSDEGVGCLGGESYRFVELLRDMGVGVWQLLPLTPLSFGNSPYQPFSSHAGDELYISLELLEREGWLPGGYAPYPREGAPDRIDYERVRAYKEPYLRAACARFYEHAAGTEEFLAFRRQHWVYPYAVFMALKKQNGMRPWTEWPEEQRNWILDGRYDLSPLEEEIRFCLFTQYMFRRQWRSLKTCANERGLQIMGDIPFYVGLDSLDVWRRREDFLLRTDGRPDFVAGVPPDYFNDLGQRWGNPIYNWENMERNGFAFWLDRLSCNAGLYDILRIDHFRAFDTYWKIPASCDTAVEGEWSYAPGRALFREIYRQMPGIRIMAEDLGGDLSPGVAELREAYGIPGMNVAEFTLLSGETPREDQLAYTATHDNQTARGYYESLPPEEQLRVREILRDFGAPGEPISRKLLRYVFLSAARLAIVPLADVLDLDDRARINTPGTVGSPNWEWRLESFEPLLRERRFLRSLLRAAGRAG